MDWSKSPPPSPGLISQKALHPCSCKATVGERSLLSQVIILGANSYSLDLRGAEPPEALFLRGKGESEQHRRLKEWARDNSIAIGLPRGFDGRWRVTCYPATGSTSFSQEGRSSLLSRSSLACRATTITVGESTST